MVDRYQQHEIPQISVAAGYGPALQAFVVYLMVMHHIPAHRCVALLESLTGAAPSVGFVHGMLARTAGLLAEVDKRIAAMITMAYVVCCDETPVRIGPRKPTPGKRKADTRRSPRASITAVTTPSPPRRPGHACA
ncbi:MAG TPA: transposase [Pseudonocardiaceae bacterium]